MDVQYIKRLLWQIPTLIILAASLIPDFSWYSNTFGFWPVWILGMPFAVIVHHWLSNRKKAVNEHAVKQAQVLVFNQKKRMGRIALQKSRQAA
jgi:hypothetical protein